MNPIFAAALEVQAVCREEGLRFCFIGGLAVQRWGEPRLTVHADLTVSTALGQEEKVVDALLRRFRPRLEDARRFALRNRVVLLESAGGVPVDAAIGAIPFEQRMLERSSACLFEPGVEIVTCGAEDLVVLKAFAGREKDWLDVEGILIQQTGRLDCGLVWRELEPLLALKEDRGAADRLRELVHRV